MTTFVRSVEMDEDSTALDQMSGALVLRSRDTVEHLYGLKEWEKRFGNNIMLMPRGDYKSFLDIMRDFELETVEIVSFMLPYPKTPCWERCVSNAESFCEHGDFAL